MKSLKEQLDKGITFLSKGSQKEIEKFWSHQTPKLQKRLLQKINQIPSLILSDNFGKIKKLKGSDFKYTRIGDYRILFLPDTNNNDYKLVRIDHRKNVYEDKGQTYF